MQQDVTATDVTLPPAGAGPLGDNGAAMPSTPPPTLDILHLDDHLVAVHKPAGMLVHRTALAAPDERFAMQTVRDQLGRHVFPVHRLDRGTSGVLLMALDPGTAHQLSLVFAGHSATKTYLGFVRGWPPLQGEVDHPLSRLDEDLPRTDRGVSRAAQPARTSWQRLGCLEVASDLGPHPTCRYALLHLWPHSGRQHQLRRHLKHLSHPLIGDATYGKGPHNRWWAARLGLARLWLHAARLQLPHPATGTPLDLAAPPGREWAVLTAQPGWAWEAGTQGVFTAGSDCR